MKLFVKNMVCNRCIAAVELAFDRIGIAITGIQLGEVSIVAQSLSGEQLGVINAELSKLGFELADDRRGRIIEKIKNVVIQAVHYANGQRTENYSDLIVKELHSDYSHLSKLFSEVEGTTIERYIINQKVEKIKEYLVYNEINLSEIADRMGYSSVAHLSAQFKKATGLPPSHFKNIGIHQRKALDKVK
jgi:AraC-like DNA-binding protein